MKYLVPPKEIAPLLDIHIDTVRALLRTRKLPGVRVGNRWMMRRTDLAQMLVGKDTL